MTTSSNSSLLSSPLLSSPLISNHSTPLVSVLMPVYNGEKYLSEAIESILKQTYTNFELIIIDDGSTDNSKKIIESYSDKRIVFVENDQNRGIVFTLNRGIDLSKGEYIARMDADDISLPTRSENQVNFLERHSDIGMCGASAYRINNNGKVIGKLGRLCSSELLQVALIFSSPYIHPLMLFRSSLLKNNHYDLNFRHAEDYELWVRLSHVTKGYNLPQYLLRYRWHDSNVTIVYNDEKVRLDKSIISKELKHLGIEITDKQYETHISSFENRAVCFEELYNWFRLLIEKNKSVSYYSQDALVALLHSRWLLSAIRMKQYRQIFKWKWYSCKSIKFTMHILLHKR